ncbi:hypothetical protein [Paenibacillus sp.]|uniref:hypothetical protein n=1 Tax=Paenibacillus sp. TaxID=58172 RepID=UPI002D722FB5|nr:hypothetical protein [Paenibacillus sp.]HZG58401.1 hypothetical protein [Paenibacillus sp.]
MTLPTIRTLLLSSVASMFLLLILDVWIKKEEMFESFAAQFVNAERTEQIAADRQAVRQTAERRVEVPANGIETVSLAVERGNIAVRRSDGASIMLQATVTAAGADAETAGRRLDQVQVAERVENGVLTFRSTHEDMASGREAVTIDYALSVPDGVAVRVELDRGNVDVSGVRSDVETKTGRGVADIVGVTGDVTATVSEGELYVAGIEGSVTLSNRNGTATVEDVTGDVALDAYASSTYVSRIDGAVEGTVAQGAAQVRDVSGPLALTGRVANLRLGGLRGDADISAEYGKLRLYMTEPEGYALQATVDGGVIRTRLPIAIKSDSERPHLSRMNGVVGDGTWKITIDAAATDVILHANDEGERQ